MEKQEIIALAVLLVKRHNSITKHNCSIYGESMDKALCRDTFSTLYVSPFGEQLAVELRNIETAFQTGALKPSYPSDIIDDIAEENRKAMGGGYQ